MMSAWVFTMIASLPCLPYFCKQSQASTNLLVTEVSADVVLIMISDSGSVYDARQITLSSN